MKIPKALRKIAVDANPILSALIGGKAQSIFRLPEITLVTTEHTIREVIGHIPDLAEHIQERGATVEPADLHFALVVAPLEVFDRNFYATHLKKAAKLIEKRDPEDVDLLALALKLSVPIWTNDQDYSATAVTWFSTAQILSKFGL